jgi:hypothetical protein
VWDNKKALTYVRAFLFRIVEKNHQLRLKFFLSYLPLLTSIMKNYLFALFVICCYSGPLSGQTSFFSETNEAIEKYTTGDSIMSTLDQSGVVSLNGDEGLSEFVEAIVVYPNPVSGELMIDLKEYKGPVLIRVYDVDLSLLNIFKERNIDMSSYRIGAYILEVEYDSRIEVMRVIKN